MTETRSPEELGRAFAAGEDIDLPEDMDTDTAILVGALSNTCDRLAESQQATIDLKAVIMNMNSNVDELNSVMRSARNAQADDDGKSLDTSVTSDHAYDEDALENSAYDWFQDAEGLFPKLIPEAVEVEFAQVDGQLGLKIEAGAPWNADCHDGNEWTDKDTWDAHRDAFKQLVDRDEIEYHGEPDYFNFLPAEDTEEVFG